MAAGQQARAAFQKMFQRMSEQARQSGAGGGPGGSGGGMPPNLGGILGGGAGIALLIGGGLAINSSLFNGEYMHPFVVFEVSHLANLSPEQSMEVIVRSNILAWQVSKQRSSMKELISW